MVKQKNGVLLRKLIVSAILLNKNPFFIGTSYSLPTDIAESISLDGQTSNICYHLIQGGSIIYIFTEYFLANQKDIASFMSQIAN